MTTPTDHMTIADIIHDYATRRGDLSYRNAREDLAAILERRMVAERAGALRNAGIKIGVMRHAITGRKVANAEWLGEVVYAMGGDIEYQSERAIRRSRTATGHECSRTATTDHTRTAETEGES